MPPKSKGQTIQLRDLQRMVYESGQVMDNILPSQSQGLERSDSYSLNKRGGGFGGNTSGGIGKLGYDRYNQIDEKVLHEVENTDWRKGRDNFCDLPSNSYGKSNHSRNNRESRYKDDIEDILENTNWRSDIKRTNSNNTSSDKYSHDYDKDIDLDFRRGSISRTNSRNNNPDLSPSSNYNWRDSSNSNQESSFYTGRYNRENSYSSSKPIIDDRPDYLKNRFKKVVNDSSQDSIGINNSLHCSNANKDQAQQKAVVSDPFSISIDRHENLTKKLAQVQSQTAKIEKKNKNNNLTAANVSLSKKNNAQKDNKKYEEPETNLSYWNVKTEDSVYAFEKDLWTCIIGEEPIEKMTPKNSFSPGTFSPPKESCVISFINNIESAFDVSDLNTLTLVAKLSHVVTIMSSSLRCLPDIISLIQSLLPLFNNLIERNIAGKNLAELYILIETQRMAFTIGNPKIDTVTSLIEGLWLALLKTKVIRRESFNLWLSKTDSLADESKVGRKNALFEVVKHDKPERHLALLWKLCTEMFHCYQVFYTINNDLGYIIIKVGVNVVSTGLLFYNKGSFIQLRIISIFMFMEKRTDEIKQQEDIIQAVINLTAFFDWLNQVDEVPLEEDEELEETF